MTEFRIETVRIGPVVKHPNADTLSITNVYGAADGTGGYPCIFRTGDFKEGDLAVYVPVDALVPVDRPAFAFLAEHNPAGGGARLYEVDGKQYARIKAKKLRKIFSMGLLVPCPESGLFRADPQEDLGILKYEPPAEREPGGTKHQLTKIARKSDTAEYERRAWAGAALATCLATMTGGWVAGAVSAPISALAAYLAIRRQRHICKRPNIPYYDIEGLRKHGDIFEPGEEVVITEKIHGCNAAFVHTGKKFFVRSRTTFRDDNPSNPGPNHQTDRDLWWQAAKKYGLEEKLRAHPGLVLFGEIYGADCQDLHYGVPAGDVEFRAFDAMDVATRKYLDSHAFIQFCLGAAIPYAPVLYRGPWKPSLAEMAEGNSTIGQHISKHLREGIVIKPLKERHDMRLGRVILKLAGEGYLLRKEAA